MEQIPTHVSIAKAGLLDGLSASAGWRKAMRGGYGPLATKPGKKQRMVSIAELERVIGRPIPRDQLLQVLAAPGRTNLQYAPRRPTWMPDPADQIELAIAKRDSEWRRWINSPRYQARWPAGPPQQLSTADAYRSLPKIQRSEP